MYYKKTTVFTRFLLQLFDTLKIITTSQSYLHQALAAWAVAFRVQVPRSPGHQYEVEAVHVLSQQSCEEQRFTSQD